MAQLNQNISSIRTEYQIVILMSGTLPFIGARLISQRVEKNDTIGKKSFECKVVEECEFFKWYVDGGNYGKGKFTKEKVDAVLRKHACGLDKGVKKEYTHFMLKNKISSF